jgi:hypothetical protein
MGGAISKAKVQHALEKDSTLLEQFGNLLEQSGVSLSGLHTDPEDSGASDGAVGIDYGWKKALEKAMKDTPLAPSLMEAIQGMRDLDGKVDVDLLEEIIKGKREEWEDLLYSAAGPFKLPTSYKIDFAIAIYVYTLNDPAVYAVVNREMFNKTRRNPGAFSGTSASLRACCHTSNSSTRPSKRCPTATFFKVKCDEGRSGCIRRQTSMTLRHTSPRD